MDYSHTEWVIEWEPEEKTITSDSRLSLEKGERVANPAYPVLGGEDKSDPEGRRTDFPVQKGSKKR